MKPYDVVVIGAGPGGYVAAIRAAQLGLRTACVDKWLDAKGKPALGGTCLNVGCIPSKALLDSSHHYHDLQHLFPAHGIEVAGASVDVAALQARKDKVVQTLTRGVAGLLRKNKVDTLSGTAALREGGGVEVVGHGGGGPRVLEAGHIIIATGSVPIAIDAAPVNGRSIVDSEGALAFTEVPGRLGIIGAGVIGLELGSVWNRLGSDVVVLEALPDFLAAADRDLAGAALKSLRGQGLDIRLGAKVTGAKGVKRVAVKYEDADGTHALEVDKLVVAVGRRAFTDGLGADALGIERDGAGRIEVDDERRTAVEKIYAIGDCVSGPMLAHKASEEGIAVAEMIAGKPGHVDHRTIPWVIYTHPEIAWVGRTEAELEAAGVSYRTGSFPFAAIGRAQAAGDTEGMVKIIGDEETDEVLGVHIFGAHASELIAEAVTVMAFHGSSEDIARTVHAHPTLAESMHEAALAVDRRALHI